MKNKYDYAYAVGRVRALELRLIPEEIFRQAVEAKLLSQTLDVLSESTREEAIKRIKDSEDLESFLTGHRDLLNQEITQLLDDAEMAKALFSLPGDLEIAKDRVDKIKLDFLTKIFQHLTNLGNLTNYLRLNLTDKITSIYPGAYGEVARESFQAKQKDNSYLFLEKLKAGFVSNFLSRARYITFGLEPIVSYYFAKLNQIRLLRWVILGKINQLPNQRLLALI